MRPGLLRSIPLLSKADGAAARLPRRYFLGLGADRQSPGMELSAKIEGRFPKLVGGAGTLRADRPELTAGSYWPFAPTLWDYVNRAMPMPAPHTLSADDVYALTAYIPNPNDVVAGEFVATSEPG